mmetsp:Transcript_13981/g.55146  ORF Transcript_13981/g.55146 Transcript_13981/m.55146 type:complete len:506 (+) Transcript_13981:144-1661(+)|eukprot:CAMPEP_0114626870 /NCGR_PEP_ID=MMETSP0168-20121206/12005_1 /TAXON_ID=95228 ORGANISM="Vannella sp., Strain DIVA3 517/6/12" /NCGR_SAMPLE_ID=MMETSP0168 /ASSEMBLY_ACC=CAM_ASM_000044 /LENGTH=505 /DNA_ID=CAMNT_0001838189 /DNA_START=99 /DNA_END=1616 /DNA_ORIENTATION=+
MTVHSDDLPFITKFFTYLPYSVAIAFSYCRQFAFAVYYALTGKIFFDDVEHVRPGYAPLVHGFGMFFERWLYRRINDLFARPVKGIPGGYMDVMLRSGAENSLFQQLECTGELKKCLNLGSYNYLGFAENSGPCLEAVKSAINDWGTTCSSSRMEMGSTKVHRELEQLVSKFVGKEDAIVFGMGYATNSTTLPALCKRGDLIVSDMLNHASIIVGCRSSGATVKCFKHNDPSHLEKVVFKAIIDGQPRTHRPWNKILIVVEGIYSMEGEILKLPEIIRIKKKYGCYLYVDEAHSIGALGPTGRGVTEYWGANPDDIDILMGTFTKSFAACGGYLAGSQALVDYLRMTAFSSVSDVAMPVPICQQIISSLSIIAGYDGTDDGKRRLKQLSDNTHYFRQKLEEFGFLIIGDYDSPVVPLMVMQPSKMPAFSRLCLDHHVAVVMASYPATELELSRARFCMTSSHTRPDIERALEVIKRVGKDCLLVYSKDDPLYKTVYARSPQRPKN